jgi:hypothetical protein
LINGFVFFILIASFEFFCRLNSKYHWADFSDKNSQSLSRLQNEILSPEILKKEFGAVALETIPSALISHYDIKQLGHYSYSDIDQNHNPNRNWQISSDGQSRTSQFSKKIKNTELTLYNVTYALNNYSKRVVEGQSVKKNAERFILAAGDSFTFGEGVTQGQDYPSQLASIISDKWTVYNYGVAGDSANDFYLRGLADPGYFEQIKETEGDFIWLYHEVQMQRLVFPTNAYESAKYILSKPEYTLDGEELIFHGFFQSSDRPFRKVLNLLAKSEIIKTFNFEIPSLYSDSNFKLFFTLLNSSVNKIESHNKKVKRKIIISYFAQGNLEKFKQLAQHYGFEVFDIERLLFARDRGRGRGGDVQVRIPATKPSS